MYLSYNNFANNIDYLCNETLWLPKINNKSFDIISSGWKSSIHSPFWENIFNRIVSYNESVTKIQDTIYNVPELLEERAFIFEFVKSIMPIKLNVNEDTKLSMLISNSYIISYLKEYSDSKILIDTPLGKLDCGDNEYNISGSKRTISYCNLCSYLYIFRLLYPILNLNFSDIIQLKNDFNFNYIMNHILKFMENNDNAILYNIVNKISKNSLKAIKNKKDLIDQIYIVSDILYHYQNYYVATIGGNNMINRRVFIVHGRDVYIKNKMIDFLREVDIKPIFWDEALKECGNPNAYTLDIIKKGFELAQAVIIILTPDENASLKQNLVGIYDEEVEKIRSQSRPNVLIEMGIAIGLYENRTILVKFGNAYIPSDFSGKNYIKFDGSIDSKKSLVNALKISGCQVDDINSRYLNKEFMNLENWNWS